MKTFDSRVYSVSDFLEWRRSNTLNISPDFQRRGVWSRAAKSYLIDTVVRGKPMPKLQIMQTLTEHDGEQKNVRTVVDGQQRLRAIFEFIAGSFTMLRVHNEDYARKKFSELPQAVQNEVLKYEIGVDVLFDVDYKDLLDIFSRINTYSVILNPQEKLNAKYLGVFKTFAYELGRTYVDYFEAADIITKKQVTRMGEAQLASDLLVVLCDGVQTVKNIERHYKKYEAAEEAPEDLETARQRFHKVMTFVGNIYPAYDLKNTNWSRPHLFYSLFCAVAHALFGVSQLTGKDQHKPLSLTRPSLTVGTVGRWRSALDEMSSQYDSYTESDDVPSQIPPEYAKFIDYARRRTTDTEARVGRANFIIDNIG